MENKIGRPGELEIPQEEEEAKVCVRAASHFSLFFLDFVNCVFNLFLVCFICCGTTS